MFRITKLADYGMVILSQLALETEQSFQASEIVRKTGINKPTVSKILKELTKKGLLHSERGVSGGYRFARSPDEITVVDIIQALEGPIALTACSLSDDSCALSSLCAIRSPWIHINRVILSTLNQISLSDLAKQTTLNFSLPEETKIGDSYDQSN